MRGNGLYDVSRGLTLAVAAGVAGVLLWVATRVGQGSDWRFWASMGIVAAGGLVLALAPLVGAWTKGLRVRLSPGTLLLGALPTFVCVAWILLATQPGSGWQEGTILRWSRDIGLAGLVHDIGLWHGVLAFGFGVVVGLSFDAVPAPVPAPLDTRAADEPTMAERRRFEDEPTTIPGGRDRAARERASIDQPG